MRRDKIKSLFGMGMMIMAILVVSAFKLAQGAEKVEDFYKGNNIKFIVPYAPGGGYDSWARGLAPYLKKYTGANIIVENWEGAGGLVGGGQLYTVSKPDGLTIGIISTSGMILTEIMEFEGVKYELAKFSHIGRVAQEWWGLFTSKASGFKTVQDMQKATKPIRLSGVDPSTQTGVSSALFLEAFGLKGKLVVGYKGSPQMMVALIAGKEIDGFIVSLPVSEQYLKAGQVYMAAQMGSKRCPRYPEIPTLLETPGLPAEGKKLLELLAILAESGRMVVAPPGTPKDRVAFLEKALMASVKEPALIEWSGKQGMEISPLSGEESKTLITRLLQIVPPEERPKFKHIVMEKYLP